MATNGIIFKLEGADFSTWNLGQIPVGYVEGFENLGNGLTETNRTALQSFYDGTNTDGTWDNLRFAYLFAGEDINYHKYNFKDYRDSDDAYRLTFNNDSIQAHTPLGYLGNRTIGRSANTHHFWTGTLTSTFVGAYVTVAEVADANNRSLIGGTNNTPNVNRVLLARSFGGTVRGELANDSGGVADAGTANRTKLGFLGVSNINGTVKLWDGTSVIATGTKTIPQAGGTIALQLLDYINNLSGNHSYSDAGIGSAVCATGLTEPEIITLIQRTIDYNVALGR